MSNQVVSKLWTARVSTSPKTLSFTSESISLSLGSPYIRDSIRNKGGVCVGGKYELVKQGICEAKDRSVEEADKRNSLRMIRRECTVWISRRRSLMTKVVCGDNSKSEGNLRRHFWYFKNLLCHHLGICQEFFRLIKSFINKIAIKRNTTK